MRRGRSEAPALWPAPGERDAGEPAAGEPDAGRARGRMEAAGAETGPC
jgi:hypothetical protein